MGQLMRFKFNSVLLLSYLCGLTAISLIIFGARHHVQSFKDEQHAALVRSSDEAARHIGFFIKEKRALVEAFANAHADQLAELVQSKEHEANTATFIAQRLKAYFPGHVTFALCGTDTNFVPKQYDRFWRGTCQTSAHRLASTDASFASYRQNWKEAENNETYVSLEPRNFRFDLDAHWVDSTGEQGRLFVAFNNTEFARIIAAQELQPHQLILFHASRPDLVQLTSNRWMASFETGDTVSEARLAEMVPRVPIRNSNWEIAYLPSHPLFQSYQEEIYNMTALIVGVISLLLGMMTFLYFRTTARLRQTEAEMSEVRKQAQVDRYSLQTLLDVVPIGIFRRNCHGETDLANIASADLFGIKPEDMLGKSARDLHDSDFANWVEDSDREVANGSGTPHAFDIKYRVPGERNDRDFIVYKAPMRVEGEAFPSIVSAVVDVSEERALRRKLEHLAATDSLTELPNRHRFLQVANHEFHRSRRYGHVFSIMMLDIDQFKSINTDYGQEAGDTVLRFVAEFLQDQVRTNVDKVARTDGKEFGFILPSTRADGAVILAERIRERLGTTVIQYMDEMLAVTVSIGIAEWSPDNPTSGIDETVRQAEKALSTAKEHGRNQTRMYGELTDLAS